MYEDLQKIFYLHILNIRIFHLLLDKLICMIFIKKMEKKKFININSLILKMLKCLKRLKENL